MPDVSANRETNEKWAAAALRIFSETFEVEQITALVGLKPTRFYAKGDLVSARSPQLRRTNAWLLKSGVAEDQGIDGTWAGCSIWLDRRPTPCERFVKRARSICSAVSRQRTDRAAQYWTRTCLDV
ncbi:MAG TPA: DUF4279 domain-containing protein [Bryobacteraceae bacterium]|jgi:hypothetical protein|nr:DUF4279 domain-containing protein [Bryobacteraceae bacterium]